MDDKKREVKQEKQDYVSRLAGQFKDAKSTIFVDYTGMSVAMQQDLKARLKEADGTMLVAKNTLIRIAGREAGFPDSAVDTTLLSGQTAVIMASGDSIAPIQILGKFASENELPTMKAGMVEGSFTAAESLQRIAKLPGKDVLLGQAMGAIAAPLYGLVGTLQGNIQKLLWILNTKATQ